MANSLESTYGNSSHIINTLHLACTRCPTLWAIESVHFTTLPPKMAAVAV